MKIVEVLGPGCAKCQRVEANAREAVVMAGVAAEIRHVRNTRDRPAACWHAGPRHRRAVWPPGDPLAGESRPAHES